MANYYGPDVSHWNGEIDWTQASGIDFIIAAVTTNSGIDSCFEQNYQSARAAGLKVGGYKYSYAHDGASSKAEAEEIVGILNNRALDMPVFLDLEDPEQEEYSASTIEDIIEEFQKVIVGAGYMFGIYCNVNWYENYIPDSAKQKYEFWIARVPSESSDDGTEHEDLRPAYGVGWQYSWFASISGVSGDFDMNVFYKNYEGEGASGEDQTISTIVENAEAIALFGRIYRHEDVGEVQSMEELEQKATEILNKNIAESITINITAFDLSLLDVDESQINLATYVTVYSVPHGMNRAFICSEIEYDLCNPAKTTYVLGDIPDTLTEKQIKFARSIAANGSYSGISRREIGWHVWDERCHVTRIRFYRSGTGVYLSFTAEVLKPIPDNNATLFMMNDNEAKYAPKTVIEGVATLSGTSTVYPLRIKPGTLGKGIGLVQVYNQGDLCSDPEKTYVVSGSITWTWT